MKTSARTKTSIAWRSATIFCLALSTPAFAAKGGKGGGNGGGGNGGGGEEPPPVELVPAPVEYHVTTIDWVEQTDFLDLYDVNAGGYAVGFCRPVSTGKNIAIMADASGNLWDLNDVFAPSLQASFPGWRLNHARAINASNEVVGLLVADSQPSAWNETTEEWIVVKGNIFDPDSLTEVGYFAETPGSWELGILGIKDLNEQGEVLLQLTFDGQEALFVFHDDPGLPDPSQVQMPSRATITNTKAKFNSAGQVLYEGFNRRSASIFLDSLYDDNLVEVLETRYVAKYGIAEDGGLYTHEHPGGLQRRSQSGSWTTVAPGGRFIVSRAPTEEEVAINGQEGVVVYRHGLGAFEVFASSGNIDDLLDWDRNLANGAVWIEGISRPSQTGDGKSGYICGKLTEGLGEADDLPFILTPIPVQP